MSRSTWISRGDTVRVELPVLAVAAVVALEKLEAGSRADPVTKGEDTLT